jgi:hypothetical protein
VVAHKNYPDAGVKAGDTIYILHYIGEGYWKVWHDGNLVDVEDFPGTGSKPKTTWWVKLKTSSGALIGLSNKTISKTKTRVGS